MKTVTDIGQVRTGAEVEKGFVIDTTFVLFFLAVEIGQTINVFAIDSIFLGLALLGMIILPYFLPSDEKPGLGNWLLGRLFITGFAVSIGLLFKQLLGVVLPDSFRFLPMTLLIITAMLSCYIQFYGFLKLRPAK